MRTNRRLHAFLVCTTQQAEPRQSLGDTRALISNAGSAWQPQANRRGALRNEAAKLAFQCAGRLDPITIFKGSGAARP